MIKILLVKREKYAANFGFLNEFIKLFFYRVINKKKDLRNASLSSM